MKTPVIFVLTMVFSISFLPAISAERAETAYFSIEVPKNWTYITDSQGGSLSPLGHGPVNAIMLVPNNFSDSLLQIDKNIASIPKVVDETLEKGGSFILFIQDADYPLKNAHIGTYVKFKTNSLNITSKENATVGNEEAVKATAPASWNPNYGTIFYFVQHNNNAYGIAYTFDKNNKDKYLPQFEEMVKSFNFIK